MKTGVESESNRIGLSNLKVGMTKSSVMNYMGKPNKTQSFMIDNKRYDIWFYLTKAHSLGQTKPTDSNMTPLIFKSDLLDGWGYRHYEYLLDINNSRERHKQEKTQKYTNNKDEWPASEHRMITPKKDTRTQEEKTPSIKEVLEDTSLENTSEEDKAPSNNDNVYPSDDLPYLNETPAPKEIEKTQPAIKEPEKEALPDLKITQDPKEIDKEQTSEEKKPELKDTEKDDTEKEPTHPLCPRKRADEPNYNLWD
jgi:outer membrane protein assembly factor BamE (lipoprotein component of BamABCDE complex)